MLSYMRCAGKTSVKCQQMTDTRFISVEKRTDMPTGLQRTNTNPLEGITIIQVYVPTSGHEADHFYQQLQETIHQTPILIVQGNWNAKVGKVAQKDWGDVFGPYCNIQKNERDRRPFEFATFNNLLLTYTLGPHKPSITWTWHSPDEKEEAVKKVKEDWIGTLCEEIENYLNKSKSNSAYGLAKDLSSEKQDKSSTIQDRFGKCPIEEQEILSRWTEYCSELYKHKLVGWLFLGLTAL